jgi:predicted  nucleic acid-binding Zn-ribbon protein
MLAELQKLLILQDRDRKIRAMRHELKFAPAQKKDLEARLVASNASFEAVRQRGRDLEVEKKRLEMDAQAKRDSIAKFRTQQFQTRKNEEFQALTNEIKRFESDITSIEDRELEIMEQAEKAKAETAEAEKDLTQKKASVASQLVDVDKKIATLEAQLKEVEADRARLATEIDEDLLNRYDRLFASKGDSAIVALEHEVCMGCHMKITTQTAVRVKGEQEIVACEQCGRLLYYAET